MIHYNEYRDVVVILEKNGGGGGDDTAKVCNHLLIIWMIIFNKMSINKKSRLHNLSMTIFFW